MKLDFYIKMFSLLSFETKLFYVEMFFWKFYNFFLDFSRYQKKVMREPPTLVVAGNAFDGVENKTEQ
jgi:hypothetical protein